VTHLDHRKPPARATRTVRRKAKRSHSAVGAAVVAGAAMVAAFAFILTNGNSDSTTDDSIRTGSLPQASTPAALPKSNPAPSVSSGKADRKPPAGKTSARTSKSVAPPNTGADSPTFRRGQWIAIIDSYPSDAGMPAAELAKGMAAKMIAAGVPAKALLANGQYPGLANSNFEPVSDTWFVYLGPVSSADEANTLCTSAKTQRAYGSFLACPTHEPATAHD
jgi:cell division septation protein DedD